MPRYTNEQVRGVLLEEAIAVLLGNAGFKIISAPGGDPTLTRVAAGIAVRGRGTDHQIDVIGDFPFVSPFANPSRLLVEGKFWERTIGIDVVRNAAGVLRDVSEWFLPRQHDSRRYHYQSAIFSASDFSEPAQHYAFAHDIVLFPLRDNALFAPVVVAIAQFDAAAQVSKTLALHGVRELTRRWLMEEGQIPETPDELWQVLSNLRVATVDIGQAYIARTSHGLPLFLVPSSRETASQIGEIGETQWMSVHYSHNEGWRIRTRGYGSPGEFSFDLPKELLRVFQRDGRLKRSEALDMKQDHFEEIHAYRFVNGRIEAMVLKLDESWLQSAREALFEEHE